MTAMPRRAAPTLESVAARAGVSRATAGRVLSGATTVNELASSAVRSAAEELGYVTNHAARSLMTRRSESVALVVSESETVFFSDPFFAGVLRGVHRTVAAHDLQLVFTVVQTDSDRTQLQRFAAGGHIDGVMCVSLHGPDPMPARLLRAGVPVVLCGRPEVPDPRLLYVDSDNVEGSRQATRLLLDRGARRLVHIAGPEDMPSAQDRLEGFHRELGGTWDGVAGDLVARGDYSLDSGRAAMAELLARVPDLDGVVASNDLMAVGAMDELEAAGRRVPDDVAVVGFDDIPLARVSRPPLTTVAQPLEAIGQRMAELLLSAIDGVEVEGPVIVGTQVVRRKSA